MSLRWRATRRPAALEPHTEDQEALQAGGRCPVRRAGEGGTRSSQRGQEEGWVM